jgi:integrase
VETDYKLDNYRSDVDIELRGRLHIRPFFGKCKAARINEGDIDQYILFRRGEEAKNATINRELATIKRAFRLGIRKKLVTDRPHITMLEEDNVRQGFFEPDQFQAVLKHLPERLRPVERFAYITGWRKMEVLTLQWRNVDFEAGIVRLEAGTTKNREARTFPFTDELRAVLEEQRARADALKNRSIITPWVFFYLKGVRSGRPFGHYKRAWATACEKAGIPGRLVHDFRRTAVRNLVRAGVPERVAMTMTGHKTRSVFERYNIVSEGDLFEAAQKLDRRFGNH